MFPLYKHWYQKAIQHAICNLDLNYNVVLFICNLYKIRTETFKKGTIYSVFRKTGMWLISCKAAIEKLKIYTPSELQPDLLTLLQILTRFEYTELGLQY